MKLLTAGCSFTKDNFQFTWADYLAKKINCELINAGARGAGIDFVKNNRFPTIKNPSVTEADESWVDLILRPLYEF